MIDENLIGNNMNRHHFKYHTWRPIPALKKIQPDPNLCFLFQAVTLIQCV